ncbi:MAG: ACP phosphodiesterase [Prolixibacteraceae bacterium]|jgi:acyl carrier protein phosphodiesterase|nr:ACP phosphodiesterase [Prolixibacteraceae bacterium]
MNFLAHFYLSGDSDKIMLGNFIGDFVKGNKYRNYPEKVAYGICLHRSIDSFTDSHADVKACMQLLKPGYGRFSGVIVDIFFDHFLASNWGDYSTVTLRQFARHAHSIFISNFLMLPLRVKQFLPFLIQHKRLESYAQKENLFHVLEIMSKRTSLPSNSEYAMAMLHQEYELFEMHFSRFFVELTDWVESKFSVSISKPEKLIIR